MNNTNEMVNILSLVNDRFKDLDIIFEIKQLSDNVYLLNYKGRCTICFDVNLKPNKNHIKINCLEKCFPNSGTEILQNIIKLGEIIGVNSIILDDQAFFSIDNNSYVIAPLEILTTGQSWYNKFGFKSALIKIEKIYNEIVSQLFFKEVLTYNLFLDIMNRNEDSKIKNIIIGKMLSRHKNEIISEGLTIYEDFSENFPDIDTENKTIKDVLLELKERYFNKNEDVREKLTDEQSDTVNRLLDYLNEHIIYYTHDLTLTLNMRGGYYTKNKKRKGKTKKKRRQITNKKRKM